MVNAAISTPAMAAFNIKAVKNVLVDAVVELLMSLPALVEESEVG